MRKGLTRLLGVLAILLVGINYMPQALAFPYVRDVRGVTVRSTAPIGDAIEAELAQADALDAASPLGPIPHRRIFLTDGGWRWALLALQARGAFALTRPLSNAIVINRNDIDNDRVWNGAPIAGQRTLAGVIAHETTHLMINRRYGIRAVTFPTWKVEGYADHVARESSLSDAQARRLQAEDRRPPALLYWEGRRKIEQALDAGQTIDQILRAS